ncbi:MAG: LytTR family DNA-binding domain-containing protein [Prolixibacteraceae bacterium]|nr:LytTR family DNA-binding domain-containing protein [Prolixibacteraceae bacterium]
MLKAVIVEDEKYSVIHLQNLLQRFAPDIEVVEVINSGKEALKKLPSLEFHLLFLDIQFNDDFDAFELLKSWQFDQLNIIFVTSYNQYAIKAFKHNAIDYVTKPIDKDDLISAIKRARDRITIKEELNELYKTINAFKNKQIVLKGQYETTFIPSENIVYLQADNVYTTLHYYDANSNYKKIVDSKNLGFWEEELCDFSFVRIHKSFLVNMNKIVSIGNKHIKLVNGETLEIARERRKLVLQIVMAHKKQLG